MRVFHKTEKRKDMKMKKIVFKNRNWNISGNLHLPDNFDENKWHQLLLVNAILLFTYIFL